MLDSLYIKNFRLFKELKIKQLERVNLIVGRNNSGKTCLLEALQIYATNAADSVLNQILKRREENIDQLSYETVDGNYRSPLRNLFYNYCFPQPESDEDVLVIGSYQKTQERLITQHRIGKTDKDQITSWTSILKNGELIKSFDENEKSIHSHYHINHKNIINQSVIFIPSHYLNKKEVATLWNKVNLTDKQKVIVQGLQLIETKIQDIALTVSENPIPIIRLEGYSEPRPLKSMGDGLTRTFELMLALVNAKNGFLLIDEFENGLHYTVQASIWQLIIKLARELNVQVFATTHSLDCVTAFQEIIQQDQTEGLVFHLGRSALKSDKGKIIATAYDQEELQLATQTDLEIR